MNMTLLYLLTISIMINSCGNNKNKKQVKKNIINKTNTYLNEKKYTNAIKELENASLKFPNDREIKIKLAHAYAGAGKFEALNFVSILKKLNNIDLSQKIEVINEKFQKILDDIPVLNKTETKRLNQSIQTYTKLGYSPYSATNEINFKWGTLHIYRLIVTLKQISLFMEKVDKNFYTEHEIIQFFNDKSITISIDLFRSYILLKNTYKIPKKNIKKVEDSIKKDIINGYSQLPQNLKNKSYNLFIQEMLKIHDTFLNKSLHNLFKNLSEKELEEMKKSISDSLFYYKIPNIKPRT